MLARVRLGAGWAGECWQSAGKGRVKGASARGRPGAARRPAGAARLDTVSSIRRKAGVWADRAAGARLTGCGCATDRLRVRD